ncbi:MAG: hypothetical protein WCJ25_05490, partial [Candidatus Moraniibacteriota bacterium]
WNYGGTQSAFIPQTWNYGGTQSAFIPQTWNYGLTSPKAMADGTRDKACLRSVGPSAWQYPQ